MSKILLLIMLLIMSAASCAHDDCSSPKIYGDSSYRYIISNGLDCQHGQFPNAHNPNAITAQTYHFRVPGMPQLAGHIIPLGMNFFGVATNGIPFDPASAEFYNNDPRSGWNYEALNGSVNLGLDMNNAHVQPNGAYHYHGIPTDLVKNASSTDMFFVGYAADGFPIYYLYGHENPADISAPIVAMEPSYRLQTGSRPNPPGGTYNGAFTQDFIYVKGLGDLDECNGVFGATPEYPAGIYHYYVTGLFPFVPRCFKGTPDASFMKQPPVGGRPPPPPPLP